MESLILKQRNMETTLGTINDDVDELTEANTCLFDLEMQLDDMKKKASDYEALQEKISEKYDDDLFDTLKPEFEGTLKLITQVLRKLSTLKTSLLAKNPPTIPQQQPVPTGPCDVKYTS